MPTINRILAAALLLAASVSPAVSAPAAEPQDVDAAGPNKPLVQSNQLRRLLTRTALQEHGKKLMEFAAASPDKSRAFGTVGHNKTFEYVKELLEETGYYDIEVQSFSHPYSEGNATFSSAGKLHTTGWFTYGPAGDVTAPLVAVNALGCTAADYPTGVAGNIAVISRGSCEFGLKVALAGAAGAKAAIVYNNIAGQTAPAGTLSQVSRPSVGPYVPVGSVSKEVGEEIVAALGNGTAISGTLKVDAINENRVTSNLIATTKGGDHNNIVFAGGHADSVPAGPGINDNGSGSIGILEVALKLPRWSVKNAVRFAWWTAEEFGLVGSEHYVSKLSPEEVSKIAVYLNFDMIASPNYGYFVYDGDGSRFNLTGPAGSDHIEKVYEDYFKDVGLPSAPTEFSGRSDYGPFLKVGVPSGGLFTGAEGLKTEEEAKIFGGQAGVSYDVNYHKVGDTLANCNTGAWINNAKAIAHSVAYYARDVSAIPRGTKAPARRGVVIPRQATSAHGHAACGHELVAE